MEPRRLGEFVTPSDAHIHPDGRRGAFVVSRMDLEDDSYVSEIWLLDGDDVRRLTSGRADTSPRWSPDGQSLAFLRKGSESKDKPQVAILPIAGGEAKVLTEFEVGVSSMVWSPDGSKLLLQVPEYIDGIDDEEERARAPRRITHPSFRFDNLGWTHDKRAHLWVLEVTSGEVTKLTDGEYSETSPAWSTDGSEIAYVSAVDDDRWINPLEYVFVMPSEGGEARQVSPRGGWAWVGWSPTGRLHAIGLAMDEWRLEAWPLQRMSEDGAFEPITDLDRQLMPGHPAGVLAAPRFLADGTIHTLVEDRGMQRVIEISEDGVVAEVAGGPRLITGWDPSPDGTSALFTATDPVNPGEVFRWEAGEEHALTSLNEEFTASADLVMPTEFTYESDGSEIHGWVLLPPGDESVPVIHSVHGGPATQYGWGFFDEFQIFVGAGYGVVAVNPRGASGYGDTFMQVPAGRWGEDVPPDQADLLLAPYAAAEQFPRLDVSRLGVMGGSYGGLSTVMLTSIDQRYRSAIAERGVYNWVSMAGTSDIPWFIELYLLAAMPDGVDEIWKASPLARAHRITTPTLVLHSETDYRCPVEQGQQLFTLLYTQGVETELLLFPAGEGHELSRSGKPKHRVERFDAILDWHARHLAADPNRSAQP